MAAAISLWPGAPAIAAEPVDEVQVQAAYVLNFVKYSRWPALPDGPLVIAVLGTPDDAAALRALVQQAGNVQGRPVSVRLLPLASIAQAGNQAVRALDGAAGNAQVLYVGSTHASWSRAVTALAAGKPMLTIGPGGAFLQAGGMFALYSDAGHVRFAVNATAIRASTIDVSARLLMLARPLDGAR
jgi:hypothetical protein